MRARDTRCGGRAAKPPQVEAVLPAGCSETVWVAGFQVPACAIADRSVAVPLKLLRSVCPVVVMPPTLACEVYCQNAWREQPMSWGEVVTAR